VHTYVWAYEKCQRFAENKKLEPFPLIHVFVEDPFRKWGLEFIGEIPPPSSSHNKWIFTTIDYFSVGRSGPSQKCKE